MKIFRLFISQNKASLLIVLIISLLWAWVSLHSLAIMEYNRLPLQYINDEYYDHSYYISSNKQNFSKTDFKQIFDCVESVKHFEGADFIVYFTKLRDAATGDLAVLPAVCSQHMALHFQRIFDLSIEDPVKGHELQVISNAAEHRKGDILRYTLLSNGNFLSAVITDTYPQWFLMPTYNARHFDGRAQFIYQVNLDNNHDYLIVNTDNLLYAEPAKDVIFPTALTLFFTEDLSDSALADLESKIERFATITSVKEMRRNTFEEARLNRAKTEGVPVISSVTIFFTILSITLLISYKTKSTQKVMRQLGLSRFRLNLYLMMPMIVIELISIGFFAANLCLVNSRVLGGNQRVYYAVYSPKIILRFGILFTGLVVATFALVFLINRNDERRER